MGTEASARSSEDFPSTGYMRTCVASIKRTTEEFLRMQGGFLTQKQRWISATKRWQWELMTLVLAGPLRIVIMFDSTCQAVFWISI